MPPGAQVGNDAVQHIPALQLIPRRGVEGGLAGRCALAAVPYGDDLHHGAVQTAVFVQRHVGILVVRHTIDPDAPGAALGDEQYRVGHHPLPAGVGVDALQVVRDTVVHMGQQKPGQVFA